MRHYYKIIEYEEDMDCHVCNDDDGRSYLIDVICNGDIPYDTDPMSLIGKRFSCSHTLPITQMAVGVKLED